MQLLIGFDRPESLSESEMRSWIDRRRSNGGPALMLGRPGDLSGHELLWVTPVSGSQSTPEDQIADLMLDMKLLGLRPTVMTDAGEVGQQARERTPAQTQGADTGKRARGPQ